MQDNKDIQRHLGRAERMRSAICETKAPTNWTRADVDRMAEGASELWTQADELAARFPDSKRDLAEAVARIFEPLLIWSGRFSMAADLARSRSGEHARSAPILDAEICLMEALSLQGKYEDLYAWERIASFTKAQEIFALIAPCLSILSPQSVARVAFALHLLGMESTAAAVISASSSVEQSCQWFLESGSPAYWRSMHHEPQWIRTVNVIKSTLPH